MAEYKMDPLESVDIEIKADTPAVFRFIAQKRVPGRDFRDFATSGDWGRESLSRYSFELLPPVRTYTDLRFYFLMDGASNHPTRIRVSFTQNGKLLGPPVVCEGDIGGDDSVVFAKAEATLRGPDPDSDVRRRG
jgi:hypothetical protein